MSERKISSKEVKVFSSGVDMDSLLSTVLIQPSLYMGLANMVLMGVSQRFPDEFLPPHLRNRMYNGIRLKRMVVIPFCTATILYLASASGASRPNPLGGHLGGFVTSMGLAAGFFAARSVSWYYPLLATMYFTFGCFHHYRKMKLLGNNAPIYSYGDATAIYRNWKETRAAKKNARRARQAELAAAAPK